MLRYADGLANISNNSAFVIQFHTNYVRIHYIKIRVLDMLGNRMSHFSGNVNFLDIFQHHPIKYEILLKVLAGICFPSLSFGVIHIYMYEFMNVKSEYLLCKVSRFHAYNCFQRPTNQC